jgi:hypothetical protein
VGMMCTDQVRQWKPPRSMSMVSLSHALVCWVGWWLRLIQIGLRDIDLVELGPN